jgi:hypothetical protein
MAGDSNSSSIAQQVAAVPTPAFPRIGRRNFRFAKSIAGPHTIEVGGSV